MLDIDEIKERIDMNRDKIKRLDEEYRRAWTPKSPTGECSYSDFDTIHGSKKEYRVEEYYKERLRINTLIELDNALLSSKNEEIDDKLYVSLLKNNEQKVKYLRVVREYTQIETSEMLGISKRQVQRIENREKYSINKGMSPKMSSKMSPQMSP